MMARYTEPKLQGNKKGMKQKRRDFFKQVYRFLEPGEVVQQGDLYCPQCRWVRVRADRIGQVVKDGQVAMYRRRRNAEFIKVE